MWWTHTVSGRESGVGPINRGNITSQVSWLAGLWKTKEGGLGNEPTRPLQQQWQLLNSIQFWVRRVSSANEDKLSLWLGLRRDIYHFALAPLKWQTRKKLKNDSNGPKCQSPAAFSVLSVVLPVGATTQLQFVMGARMNRWTCQEVTFFAPHVKPQATIPSPLIINAHLLAFSTYPKLYL